MWNALLAFILSLSVWISITTTPLPHWLSPLISSGTFPELAPVGFDKVSHFMFYFCLCSIAQYALWQRARWETRLFWVMLATFLWSSLMEVLQLLEGLLGLGARIFEWNDLVANAVGVSVATILAFIIIRLRYRPT